LPIATACDYVRQAAWGLQHAHERGMVHRDIKPSNLLLTFPPGEASTGLIKILDLGLARLGNPQSVGPESCDPITNQGPVIGTPDYLAPEQAMNSHTVDIRAALYALGCTFYYLLVGKPPFAGGSLTEKLLQHQLDPPPPLAQVRLDAPAWLD